MKRREFIKHAGAGAVGVGLAASLSACGDGSSLSVDANAPAVHAAKPIHWKMVTTWPKNFPGLGTGANTLARLITEMSGGRLTVKVYGAKELVPAFEVFGAVSNGTAEIGHGAAYYWKGKVEEAQFFTAVPFGLTAQEMNGWLQYGGGLALWEELYRPFGLVPMPAGNTGVQMAGWFNREINSIDDLQGLKMRIPGLGGEVLERVGGTPVTLPGGEIFPSLQSGAIDATEWVGPYNDLAFGLYKAAKHYYYPGWHEPGPTLECIVNQKALDALPADLQAIVRTASRVANDDMLSEYMARNNHALKTLVKEHGVDVRKLPDEVLTEFKRVSDTVVEELAGKNAMSTKIYESFRTYRADVIPWQNLSERAYLNARG